VRAKEKDVSTKQVIYYHDTITITTIWSLSLSSNDKRIIIGHSPFLITWSIFQAVRDLKLVWSGPIELHIQSQCHPSPSISIQCWKDLRFLIRTSSSAVIRPSGSTYSPGRRSFLPSMNRSLELGHQTSTSSPQFGRMGEMECTCTQILTFSSSTGGSISRGRQCGGEQPLMCSVWVGNFVTKVLEVASLLICAQPEQ